MNFSIPSTPREIIEHLIATQALTIKEIATKIGVSNKTIYRIRNGFRPGSKTHVSLILLYLVLQKAHFEQGQLKNNNQNIEEN